MFSYDVFVYDVYDCIGALLSSTSGFFCVPSLDDEYAREHKFELLISRAEQQQQQHRRNDQPLESSNNINACLSKKVREPSRDIKHIIYLPQLNTILTNLQLSTTIPITAAARSTQHAAAMDNIKGTMDNSPLNEPLLAGTDDESDDEIFHDVHSSVSSIVSSVSRQPLPSSSHQQQQQQRGRTSSPPTRPSAAISSTPVHALAGASLNSSFYGTASKLATGTLFSSNTQGIVDIIPSSDIKACLIFSDSDIYSAIAHICLLEKEVHCLRVSGSNNNTGVATTAVDDGLVDEVLINGPYQLFSVVHACKPLMKHDDAGMRMLKKLAKNSGVGGGGGGSVPTTSTSSTTTNNNSTSSSTSSNRSNSNLEIPVLLHQNNILREVNEFERKRNGLSGLLLPRYIDESIGARGILSGGGTSINNNNNNNAAVTSYNMNLFIQRHSALPNLFLSLLSSPSPTQRIELSTKLLSLLKVINSDLQMFHHDGPYLCGKQYTLADICIFPIIERIVVVLSTYRNFWIPPSLTYLISWYETMCNRTAVRVATADRSHDSLSTYCYEKIGRNEYLLEVYECYALHEEKQFQMLNDEMGKRGVNVYREHMLLQEEEDEGREDCHGRMVKKSSCQQCVIS